MNNIKYFDTINRFEKYVITKISKICLGHGRESVCFLGIDGYVYKILHRDIYKNNNSYKYRVDEIVTVSDIDVDSYALPIEVFCVKNRLVGYTMKYVDKDLFFNNYLVNGYSYALGKTKILYSKDTVIDIIFNKVFSIDVMDIKIAYNKLCDDTIKLSEYGVKIRNLDNNIMFDGKKFMVVDTLNYTKGNNNMIYLNNYLLESSFKEELGYLYYLVCRAFINNNTNIYSYVDNMWTNFNDIIDVKKKTRIK